MYVYVQHLCCFFHFSCFPKTHDWSKKNVRMSKKNRGFLLLFLFCVCCVFFCKRLQPSSFSNSSLKFNLFQDAAICWWENDSHVPCTPSRQHQSQPHLGARSLVSHPNKPTIGRSKWRKRKKNVIISAESPQPWSPYSTGAHNCMYVYPSYVSRKYRRTGTENADLFSLKFQPLGSLILSCFVTMFLHLERLHPVCGWCWSLHICAVICYSVLHVVMVLFLDFLQMSSVLLMIFGVSVNLWVTRSCWCLFGVFANLCVSLYNTSFQMISHCNFPKGHSKFRSGSILCYIVKTMYLLFSLFGAMYIWHFTCLYSLYLPYLPNCFYSQLSIKRQHLNHTVSWPRLCG